MSVISLKNSLRKNMKDEKKSWKFDFEKSIFFLLHFLWIYLICQWFLFFLQSSLQFFKLNNSSPFSLKKCDAIIRCDIILSWAPRSRSIYVGYNCNGLIFFKKDKWCISCCRWSWKTAASILHWQSLLAVVSMQHDDVMLEIFMFCQSEICWEDQTGIGLFKFSQIFSLRHFQIVHKTEANRSVLLGEKFCNALKINSLKMNSF